MDVTLCAANRTPDEPACTARGVHFTTCTDTTCEGCSPRLADQGHLCARHYRQVERAWHDQGRLYALAATLGLDRAIAPTSSASTHAGPRVPLTALQLDLDVLDRMWAGDVNDPDGAVQTLIWRREVRAAMQRHPMEPRRERLHRVRCAHCEKATVVVDPPEIAGGDSVLRCVSCGWTTHDQEHAEAAAFTEALERDPYRPRRRRVAVRTQPVGLEALAGIARLAAALR